MAISSADILKSTQPGVMNGHLLNGVRVSSVDSQGDWQAFADTQEGVARIEIPADPQARLAFSPLDGEKPKSAETWWNGSNASTAADGSAGDG